MYYIAFDPGATTGIAEWEEGRPLWVAQYRIEDLYEFLHRLSQRSSEDSCEIIVEDYKVRPSVNHAWSDVNPVRVIGAIQFAAWLRKANFHLQQPAIKPVGYAMAGIEYKPNKKGTHWQDACAHLAYYLCTKEGMKNAPWLPKDRN